MWQHRRVVESIIDKRIERRNRWIADAESGYCMDHRALAAQDRNEATDLELLGRMAGLFKDGAAGHTTVQVAIVIPEQSHASEPRVIDIAEKR